ncbi:hypothetical protein [Sporomusa aerivorans]|jgi:hypothetical protein|uniref:hypothetical protein n=1 Tax=Sporomusa aerivorans TaxID=204936 RepID=UPI00352B1AC4
MMTVSELQKGSDKFIEFVQQKAKERGQSFFIDSGEGRDKVVNDMYVEDLSGWLINPDEEAVFVPQWERKNVDEKFDHQYVFAIWQEDSGKLNIEFRRFH